MDRKAVLPVLRDRHPRKPGSFTGFVSSPYGGFESYWFAYSICGLAIVVRVYKVKVNVPVDLDAILWDNDR